MPKKFWKNKKILITGIDGFVGSNLAKRLTGLGANVSGIIQKKKIHYYILSQYIKNANYLKVKLQINHLFKTLLIKIISKLFFI